MLLDKNYQKNIKKIKKIMKIIYFYEDISQAGLASRERRDVHIAVILV